MIGRKEEIAIIEDCLNSGRPEFIALYGRRRVGKTYLVREYFNDTLSFYATGVPRVNTRKQLKVLHEALTQYGDENRAIPKDWFEAFSRIRKILEQPEVAREPKTGRRVVFLDELPWMDTTKSDFKSALDYFWNSYGSAQKDLLLIVCGSATSWIINHIVKDTGGFYNRVTRQIHLMPFCLEECRQLLSLNGMQLTDRQIVESHMVFGGIPYYLNYLKPSMSLAQNVETLFFGENAPLAPEFERLFSSLFLRAEHYTGIARALSRKNSGLTRQELLQTEGIVQGKELTKCLNELEQCGFIRKYRDYTHEKNGCHYQLIDPLSLFHFSFLESGRIVSWMDYINTPAYYNWRGLAFERVCLLHLKQIKSALGISGISTQAFSWVAKKHSPGTQIDLLIDRKDDVINLCEMKYAEKEFEIDAAYEKELINKIEVFRNETGTKKAVHLTMISFAGVKNNQYKGIVVNELTGTDLFR